MFLPCSGRTIQRSRRVSGAFRSISLQPEIVKSCPLPDFPRGLPSDGAQSRRAARSRRSRRGGWSRPPTAWIRRLSSLACRSRPRRANPARSMAATPVLVELQHVHSGLGQFAVADRPFGAAAPHARRRRAAIRPQPRPFEARIDVRGIVEPRHAAREERGGEPGPRYREQRPQQAHVGLLDQGRHAGQTVGTALAGSPHRHGLGLIIGVMGEQQVQDAAPAAFVAQQPVARRPRRLLQASPRLGAATR